MEVEIIEKSLNNPVIMETSKDDNNNTDDDDKSTIVAPIAVAARSKQLLKTNLRVLLSNLYMKSAGRLPGAAVPRCLYNTSLCVSNHRCAMLPNAPDISVAQDLTTNLHSQQYDTYLQMLEMLALQTVYPGEGVFERLLDMVMILSTKSMTMEELRQRYEQVLRIYYLLLDAFPPCWTTLRPYYLHFLGINTSTDVSVEKTPQKLQVFLDVLEDCLAKCSEQELTQYTSSLEALQFDYDNEKPHKVSDGDVFLGDVEDFDWESDKQWIDDVKKMSNGVQLARVFNGLDMLCSVLEREFLSWLDHNRLQQAEADIFQEETKPFVLIVFGIKSNLRLTAITKQLLRLYSRAVAKDLHQERLNVLHRYISLLMEASNTAELQYVDNAVVYPSLGTQTQRLIVEFLKIFKAENPSNINSYVKQLSQLQQPYVRFTFADQFLQLFYFSSAPFNPAKISEEFKAKQWLKYKPKNEQEQAELEQLSREDYLRVLLNALQDYCKWLNLKTCWNYIKTKKPIQPLQTTTSSPLATPVGAVTGNVGKVFELDEMQKESHTWKQRMNLKVIVSKPKVSLPVARISVTKIAEVYGTDLRQLRYLRRVLLVAKRFIDVTEWLSFLDDFLGEDTPPASSEA
ncbi:CG5664 [Drosophila busckii]|uniref:CG5664 n=1 Tax=Drosophila busckii TaxID=30019 RepID=A0A0M4EZ34_DROBS|nr:uncharacterized protein LOC108598802 [Drosophila busckii]ALC43887.1 CG5664 [Drosophila busckii]